MSIAARESDVSISLISRTRISPARVNGDAELSTILQRIYNCL